MSKLIIGSHVSLSSPDFLLGAVKETLSYRANTFMIYTGAPQNTIRRDTSELKIKEGHQLMKDNNIDFNNVIVHAPYIINLCSNKSETRQLANDFLLKELIRTHDLGFNKLVLHPGSAIDQSYDIAINQIASGINFALKEAKNNVIILLETMAGKGSEIGWNIEHLRDIINKIEQPQKIGICLDTCHLSDAGYNIDDFDAILTQIDLLVGIDKIQCVHVNDSMNEQGARKDRHQNLGYGKIGFDKLLKIIYHPKLSNIPKILETPYVQIDNKSVAPYQQEIAMINIKSFNNWLKK